MPRPRGGAPTPASRSRPSARRNRCARSPRSARSAHRSRSSSGCSAWRAGRRCPSGQHGRDSIRGGIPGPW